MQTHVMTNSATATPYLEHFPEGAKNVERTELKMLPVTIGRSNAADLVLPSNQVSREHASIVRKGASLCIVDLGSTNGTFLNGEATTEAVLNDGDILLIADFELTFCSGEAQRDPTNVTQVMDGPEASGRRTGNPDDLIAAARRFHATLAHRAFRVLFQPIVPLEGGPLVGYRALTEGVDFDLDGTNAVKRFLATECRLSERVRHAARQTAVDEARQLPDDLCLVLRLHPSEIGTDVLHDSLLRTRDSASDKGRIIFEVPDSAVSDLSYFQDFRDRLDELGMLVVYSQFNMGTTRLMEHQKRPPDFLRLDASLVTKNDLTGEQAERFRDLIEASRTIGTQVIASGVETPEQVEALVNLGCPFALGNYLGRPRTARSLVHHDPLPRVQPPAATSSKTPLDVKTGTRELLERVFQRKPRTW